VHNANLGAGPRVSLKALLEAGVHFGHQAKRWNPKMKPYIFTERNGVHIIDLQQTVPLLETAHAFIADLTARGGKVLFVGTKKQAQDVVEREAARSGQFYVNRRWLGGTLTNFVTIRNRLRTLKQLQAERDRGELAYLPKQEAAARLTELERLERTLGGMRDMTQLPGAIFVIDPKREHLAIHEARRLGIPVIAITDTNCDPDDVDYLIPGNDDAIRSVRLITNGIAEAALAGQTRAEIAYAERAGDAGAGRRAAPEAPLFAEALADEAEAAGEAAVEAGVAAAQLPAV
jgi:small subunit ribosomal protein S2